MLGLLPDKTQYYRELNEKRNWARQFVTVAGALGSALARQGVKPEVTLRESIPYFEFSKRLPPYGTTSAATIEWPGWSLGCSPELEGWQPHSIGRLLVATYDGRVVSCPVTMPDEPTYTERIGLKLPTGALDVPHHHTGTDLTATPFRLVRHVGEFGDTTDMLMGQVVALAAAHGIAMSELGS